MESGRIGRTYEKVPELPADALARRIVVCTRDARCAASFLHAQRRLARGPARGQFHAVWQFSEDGGLGWHARGAS